MPYVPNPLLTFNGYDKTITIEYGGAVTDMEATEIYSAWKEWVADGNAQFLPAFGDAVGGNPLGGGVSLAGYYFLRNDLGWRITHANNNYEIRIAGDLYPADPSGSFIQHGDDPFAVTFVLQRSAASYVSETGVSGLLPAEAQALALIEKLLRNRRETNPSTGKQTIYDDDGVTVLVEGDLWEDVGETQPYRGQGADLADRLA